MQLIIFTDLDGSLLNHEDYSFEEAMPSIGRIKRAGIPLIITTSKTRPEVEHLQQEMGIREPFIVENGGGIFFPRGYRNLMIENGERQEDYTLICIGTRYSMVRRFLKKTGSRFDIKGFGDLTTEEISGLTGLSPDRAEMAKAREFTEPILLERPEVIDCLSVLAAGKELK
ncbi:mannosyl-3-phosphoglycerate phosphatase, partial [bacterium]